MVLRVWLVDASWFSCMMQIGNPSVLTDLRVYFVLRRAEAFHRVLRCLVVTGTSPGSHSGSGYIDAGQTQDMYEVPHLLGRDTVRQVLASNVLGESLLGDWRGACRYDVRTG